MSAVILSAAKNLCILPYNFPMLPSKAFLPSAVLMLAFALPIAAQTTDPVLKPAPNTSQSAPAQPRDDQGNLITGACDVSLKVDKSGNPKHVHVIACNDERLTDYAASDVKQRHYIPLTDIKGKPTTTSLVVSVIARDPAESSQSPQRTASDRAGVLQVGGGISAPNLIYHPEAGFTEAAREAKARGTVEITCTISPDGNVEDSKITKSFGADSIGQGLDISALNTVKTYLFKPAMLNGKPVAVKVIVQVGFSLYSSHGPDPI